MWDYNNDGVIDYQDEADYWDDIYFEEHRDEYTPGLFSQSRYTPPKKEEKVEELGVASVILGVVGYFIGLVMCGVLAFFGLALCFVFPPLGIIMMIPLYKMLGGK